MRTFTIWQKLVRLLYAFVTWTWTLVTFLGTNASRLARALSSAGAAVWAARDFRGTEFPYFHLTNASSISLPRLADGAEARVVVDSETPDKRKFYAYGPYFSDQVGHYLCSCTECLMYGLAKRLLQVRPVRLPDPAEYAVNLWVAERNTAIEYLTGLDWFDHKNVVTRDGTPGHRLQLPAGHRFTHPSGVTAHVVVTLTAGYDHVSDMPQELLERWAARFPPHERAKCLDILQKMKSDPSYPRSIRSFGKTEAYVKEASFDSYIASPDPAVYKPRLILGRSPEHKCHFGPHVFVAQNNMVELLAPPVPVAVAMMQIEKLVILYTSKYSDAEVGTLAYEAYKAGADVILVNGDDSLIFTNIRSTRVVLEGDYAQFEASLNEDDVRAALSIARIAFGLSKVVSKEILEDMSSVTGSVRCASDGKISFKMDGLYRQCSGNTWTSLLNTIIDMILCLRVLSLLKSPDLAYAVRIASLSDGDGGGPPTDPSDLVFRRVVDFLTDRLLDVGYTYELKIHDSLDHASFCSRIFWPALVDSKPSAVLGPTMSLAKVHFAAHRYPKPDEWLRGVALSRKVQLRFGGPLKILNDGILSFLGTGGSVTHEPYLHKPDSTRNISPDPERLTLFLMNRYGLSRLQVMQLEMEAWYAIPWRDPARPLDSLLFPVWRHCARIDEGFALTQ
jgi:hypothetical protein